MEYTENAMEKALEEVADGKLSLRAAVDKYNVPKSTIHRKYRGHHPFQNGGQTVLTKTDEEHIVNGLLISATWGFPFTPLELRKLVKRFLDRKGTTVKQFNDNLPGRYWLTGFLKRHKTH